MPKIFKQAKIYLPNGEVFQFTSEVENVIDIETFGDSLCVTKKHLSENEKYSNSETIYFHNLPFSISINIFK